MNIFLNNVSKMKIITIMTIIMTMNMIYLYNNKIIIQKYDNYIEI